MNRYTFVIQVHADGPSTLENLSTHELISLPDLERVGPQIERWLRILRASGSPTTSAPAAGTGDRNQPA